MRTRPRAKRMAICCSQLNNNGSSKVNFKPDCYSWCNVDPSTQPGSDPLLETLSKLSACLEQGQGPAYTPDVFCAGGTASDAPHSSTSPHPVTTHPSSTPPTGHVDTSSGLRSRGTGISIKTAIALVAIHLVLMGKDITIYEI
nr:hypothetical protein CFP56_78659 [Quercus suber]